MVGAVVVAHVIGSVAAAAVVRAGEYDNSGKLIAIWWAAAMVKVVVLALWCCVNVEVLRRRRTRGGDVDEQDVVLEGTVLRW